MRSPTSTNEVGLHNFVKIRLLGSGTCGRVYLVKSKGLPLTGHFAMKVINKSDAVRHERVQRTMTEREILAFADHPFIVRLYYAFQTKRFLYMVMQLCEGGHLHQTIRAQPHGFLCEDMARFYAAEVLVVLEYLHMMGVLYEDLKPKNILLRANGHIVLCDFDASSIVNPLEHSATSVPSPRRRRRRWPWDCITRCIQSCWGSNQVSPLDAIMPPTFHAFSNGSKGPKSFASIEYIAPEVLASHKGHRFVHAIDWWAFGVLLYQMLFAKTPFQGDNDDDTRQNILHDDLVLPYSPAVSPSCRDLLFLLLDKNVRTRLKSNGPIKAHAFFSSINWARIQDEMPPLIPKPIRLTPALTDQLEDPPCACDLVAPDDDQFYSFNFTRTCMGDDLPL
ncbi:AGC/RSK/RSK-UNCLASSIFIED protein kinase [Aphanomyces invadans]|uniref:non-specific serine/threonine protein kinase n=1 Tax=Aphanomyces invadans TaxID=157072 RepID=A0A024T9Q8_9STRA|nr:AGC/RSK/RSK-UNCLASSIFIED protein kinase [Aphanomyces invadans]ETV90346.1 AGC/RSK/RSK-UNCLASSIFIED protein kinase [Aphanomyces invadans]|eukprot:XP_008881020.1 AGC/RSK/RSK-UNCLASSIFIED protein kinase [Aphanomyces invadans]